MNVESIVRYTYFSLYSNNFVLNKRNKIYFFEYCKDSLTRYFPPGPLHIYFDKWLFREKAKRIGERKCMQGIVLLCSGTLRRRLYSLCCVSIDNWRLRARPWPLFINNFHLLRNFIDIIGLDFYDKLLKLVLNSSFQLDLI